MDLTFRLRKVRHDALLAPLIAVGIFVIALALRVAVPGNGAPFITFYPAVVIASFISGAVPGALVAILSQLAVYFIFSARPMFLGYSTPNPAVPFLAFTFASIVVLMFVHLLHRTVDNLWLERERGDAMFRELQHRVANNMQLVASVLQLERTTVRSKADSLAAAQQRLEILGNIHRRLYDPAASERPATTHLAVLCSELVRASGRDDIKVDVEQSELTLGPERLVILSLLTSEVVTNCLKHAFNARGGHIQVSLRSEPTGSVLVVADDGEGSSAHADTLAPSLGRGIINTLAAHLRGRVDYLFDKGTTVRVTFEPG